MKGRHLEMQERIRISAAIAVLGLLVGTPCHALSEQLTAAYGEQQMQRLAAKSDRDSVIAAALIGLPNNDQVRAPAGHAEVVRKLVADFGSDPLAVYTATLICQVQAPPCAHKEWQAQLLQLAPDNALNFLLLPNAAKPSAAQLHAAAAAGRANSHLSELLGIVRAALAEQPAPALAAGETGAAGAAELALALRRNELAQVPWPKLGPTSELCSAKAAAQAKKAAQLAADCASLGLALFADEGHSIVVHTFGGTFIRRFAPDSPTAAAARDFRRQYVWLSELPPSQTSSEKEQVNADEVTVGEWEALQRHAERTGATRQPPTGWVPKDPQALLLPEERTGKQ